VWEKEMKEQLSHLFKKNIFLFYRFYIYSQAYTLFGPPLCTPSLLFKEELCSWFSNNNTLFSKKKNKNKKPSSAFHVTAIVLSFK
jgi:hypothetical protein